MSNSRDLIQAIVDEDFVSAKEMTNNLIFGTVSDELDQVRRDVAEDLFDVCEECDQEDMHEQRAKADFDDDGVVETPKKEVLGSRINAAVAAKKLSPMQAARTKNKGMYR